MKKNTIIIIALVIFIFGVYLFTKNNTTNVSDSELFQNELIRAGVEIEGQPIEGFDAEIYLSIFPGFIAEDFHGVATTEGVYSLDNGELVYTRTHKDLVTSAEKTITDDGYAVLLKNLSDRFGIDVYNLLDMENLLEKLREGDPTEDNKKNIGAKIKSGVVGRVFLGPQCPVMRKGDSICEDKPYQTKIQVFSATSLYEALLLTLPTNSDGEFEIELSPTDTYSIKAVGGDPFPRCESRDVTIGKDEVVYIELICDTGIR